MKLRGYIVGIVSLLFLNLLGAVHAQDVEIESLELDGKIAFVGDDFNVYTLDFETDEIHQLTDDGTRRASYEFPTWSVDGQLAYFCCSVRGLTSPRLSIYLSRDGVSQGAEYYNQDGQRHVYAYWSPRTCDIANCVDLAVLIQDFSESQLRVELFNSRNADEGQRSLGRGMPFYYSWSSSGETLLLHRNNRTLQYYSTMTSDTTEVSDEPLGNFLSPGWSPVDDRILFASASNDDFSKLTIIDRAEQQTLVDSLRGVVSFSWSPDGQYVAYRVINSNSISSVYVLNSVSGEIVARSNVSGAIAFFWSPDSSKVAYITLSNPPGTFDIKNETGGMTASLTQVTDGLAWNILEISDSSNTLLNSFIPTQSMQYLLTNFDQFAQSHSIWSPDSQYLLYSERAGIDSRDSLITILDVNDPEVVPLAIVEGSFAVWSFE